MGAKTTPPVDPATRTAILQRAEAIGDLKAAKDAGVSPSSLRSWRHRARAREARAPTSAPTFEEHGATAEDLRARAAAARAGERRALEKCDRMLANGKATSAKAASGIAADAAARAVSLERAAREIEEAAVRLAAEDVKLSRAQQLLVDTAIRGVVAAVGMPWNTTMENFIAAVHRAVADAPIVDGRRRWDWPQPETRLARDAVERHLLTVLGEDVPRETDAQTEERIGKELRELAAEHGLDFTGQGERAPVADTDSEPQPEAGTPEQQPEPVAAVDEPVEPTGPQLDLPAWEELPEDWQRRYSLNPPLGRWEYANHLRRQKRLAEERAERPPSRASRHEIPRIQMSGPSSL